jgi:hypothetical protein
VRELPEGTWPVENLFDEENAVALGRRTDKVFRAIKNDIAGWTPQLRNRKIEQLAWVIAAMNTGHGPDWLGVCEVENRFVVDRLVERVNATLPAPRSYAVVHADTGDARGIDVAFIYDDTLLRVPLPLVESVFFHVVMHRNATREIVQVNFKTTTAAVRTWAVFGNHWPSRRGSQVESEGLPRHCRGDAGLFPPAGSGGAWTQDTGAGAPASIQRSVRKYAQPQARGGLDSRTFGGDHVQQHIEPKSLVCEAFLHSLEPILRGLRVYLLGLPLQQRIGRAHPQPFRCRLLI